MKAKLFARPNKTGSCTIIAEYRHDDLFERVPTGVKVDAGAWDAEKEQIRLSGNPLERDAIRKQNLHILFVRDNLNAQIKVLFLAKGNVYPSVTELRASKAATVATQAAAATLETPLTDLLSNYLETRTRWAETTRKNFRTLHANIKAFEKATKTTWLLSTLDNAEITKFQHWLLKTFNYKNSTAAKRNRLLKQFLTEHTAPNVAREKVKPLHKQMLSQPVVLEKAEIKALLELPYDKASRLGQVRNMAILQIFTGLRYGDLIRLQTHHIKGKREKEIVIREEKTNQTRTIPVFPQAQAVLDLYTDSETGALVLPAISNQKFNKYLAEIVAGLECLQKEVLITTMERDTVVEKWEPKHLHIRSHSSRRTFCSLLLGMDYSIRETMTLSGHKSLAAFQRYVGKSEIRPNAVADFSARWNA